MSTAEGAARARKIVLLIAVSFASLLADQVTKYWAVAELTTALNGRAGFADRLHGFFAEQNLDNDPNDVPGRPLRALRERVVLPGYWNHRYVENPGAAWGIFSGLPDPVRAPFFIAITVLALGFIGAMYVKVPARHLWMQVALALVLGGALGNFVDRIARGYVIDFIDWHWRNQPGLRWPTFNIADAAISVGVVMMLLDSARAWLQARRERPARERSAAGLPAGSVEPPVHAHPVSDDSGIGAAVDPD